MTADLLTADELAARLQVRPTTIHLWTRAKKIPARRLTPKVVRYDLAAVVAAMENHPAQKNEGEARHAQ